MAALIGVVRTNNAMDTNKPIDNAIRKDFLLVKYLCFL